MDIGRFFEGIEKRLLNMHILLWAPLGAGTHYWGPGTSAYRLYKRNRDKNVKVTLVHASNSQDIFDDVFDEQIQIGDIENKTILNNIIYFVKSFWWIRKNYGNYDVFHGITAYIHAFLPALFFTRYKKTAYIKLTGQHGGFGNNSFFSKIIGFRRLRLKNANTLAGYISISSDITKNLVKSGIKLEKIHYIPNGVNTDVFFPLDKEEKEKLRSEKKLKNRFTVSYIGGLTQNKRVIDTVKAIHSLLNKNYDIQLLIVGPDRSGGVADGEILEYINKYSLSDNCIRIEHTSNPDIYFKVSDVFVLNSEFEGLSNSLLESMASGLPCVASPASGTVDLIEDGITGFLTDGSAGQIEEKIAILYNDDSLRMQISSTARKKILERFSVDYIWQEHLKLFKTTIEC